MRLGLSALGNHNHEAWVPPPVMTMGASWCNYRSGGYSIGIFTHRYLMINNL